MSQNGDYFETISLTVFLGSIRKNCKICVRRDQQAKLFLFWCFYLQVTGYLSPWIKTEVKVKYIKYVYFFLETKETPNPFSLCPFRLLPPKTKLIVLPDRANDYLYPYCLEIIFVLRNPSSFGLLSFLHNTFSASQNRPIL